MSWSDIAPLYGLFGTDWIAMEATETAPSSNSSCDSARPIPPSGSSSRRTESPPQSSDFPPRRGSFHPAETTPDLPIARTIPSALFRSPIPLQILAVLILLLLLWHRHNSRSSNGSESIYPKIHRRVIVPARCTQTNQLQVARLILCLIPSV